MTAKRTLKRNTLKALERAAMRWWRWMETKGYFVGNPFYRVTELGDACAAHAQSQAGGKRRRK